MHRLWWVIALVGCYRPAALDDCLVTCGAQTGQTCPPDQTCDENGKCKSVDRDENCPSVGPLDAFEFQDAAPDMMLSGTETCWGAPGDFFRVCVDPTPTSVLDVTTTRTLDTGSCPQLQTQSAPPAVCVYAFSSISIATGATLRIKGPRPAALVSVNSITVNGTIDVSSSLLGGAGANSGVSDCNVAAAGNPAAGATAGGGGGAGGSLFGAGGRGGTGTGGSTGGDITPIIDPSKLMRIRGGCHGGNGGKSTTDIAGVGGAGGGAVYLMAKGMITLTDDAIINASGAGGAAPGARSGGGGGGSGGFIGFHGENGYNFSATAQIYAIGGGGASGGGATVGGKVGAEAIGPAMTAISQGPSGAGNGGFGAPAKGDDGTNAPGTGGGGGGGGGGGKIGFEGAPPPAGQFAPPHQPL